MDSKERNLNPEKSTNRRIDRSHVTRAFDRYTAQYDPADPKIALKIAHTRRVAALSERIAGSLQLPAADIDLAWLNGMLHDIGRFEQVRRYGTFLDAASVNHAELGAELLFAEGLIRRFLAEDAQTDRLIERAVALHNRLELPEDLSGRERMFCQILRDADKTDILHVMCETPFSEIYGLPWEAVLTARISDEVFDDIMSGRTVNRAHSRTAIDYRIGHIALINGLVYPESRRIVRESGTLEELLRIDSRIPETRDRLEAIRGKLGDLPDGGRTR